MNPNPKATGYNVSPVPNGSYGGLHPLALIPLRPGHTYALEFSGPAIYTPSKGLRGLKGCKGPGRYCKRGFWFHPLGGGMGGLQGVCPGQRGGNHDDHRPRPTKKGRPTNPVLYSRATRTVPTCPKGETLSPLGSFETGFERFPARTTDKNDHCGRAREQPVNGQGGTTPDLRARGGSPWAYEQAGRTARVALSVTRAGDAMAIPSRPAYPAGRPLRPCWSGWLPWAYGTAKGTFGPCRTPQESSRRG